MLSRKLFKRLGIIVATLVVLVVIGITAFVFDPFESGVDDMRRMVPADVDFFLRKDDLADDLGEFPAPAFFEDIENSRAWRDLRKGQTVADLRRDLLDYEAQLKDIAVQIEAGSGGFVSLVDDVVGDEVIFAGRMQGRELADAAWCAYMRVSWKIRAGVGMLDWDSVRSGVVDGGGPTITPRDDGIFTIETAGEPPMFLGRHRDCLMVANDETLLLDSMGIPDNPEARPFGTSSLYRDKILSRIEDWRGVTGVSEEGTNAMEMFVRTNALFDHVEFDDGWPDANHPDSVEQRVLSSFLNLKSFKDLGGSFLFEQDSLTWLGDIRIDQNAHSSFQTDFFRAEPQERRVWLDPFFTLVPREACAAAALRVPAADFLREMAAAIDPEIRREIDQLIKSTGRYESLDGLVETLRPSLRDRIGVVFKRQQDPNQFNTEGAERIETYDPSADPDVAWVFWLDDRFRGQVRNLIRFMQEQHRTFEFRLTDLPIVNAASGDVAQEFNSPNIPATGQLVACLFRDFFIFSNSGGLVRNMVQAQLDSSHLGNMKAFQPIEAELGQKLNGFVWLNGPRLVEVAEDQVTFLVEEADVPDPGWMVDVRGEIEAQVLRNSYPGIRSSSSLRPDQQDEFEDKVTEAMSRRWGRDREGFLGPAIADIRENQAFMRLVDRAFMQIELGPRELRWKARALLNFR
ncbi:MAG: hypothetical protein AAF196_06310 [Planctomycetota bacterium]